MTDQETFSSQSEEWKEAWLLFSQEGKETLDIIEASLLHLEAEPGNRAQIAELFRAMHNFKGMARMMGLSVTENLAHHAEDVVALVRDEGVSLTSDMISVLLMVLDQLRLILTQVTDQQTDISSGQVETLVQQLKAVFSHYSTQPGVTAPANQARRPPDEAASLEGVDDLFFASGPDEPEEWAELAIVPSGDPPGPSLELIDPAADLGYVQVFLEMVESELGRLHSLVEVLIEATTAAPFEELAELAGTLKYAAQQLGYNRLVGVLDDLLTISPQEGSQDRMTRLNQIELQLFEELTAIEAEARNLDPTPNPPIPAITWLFRSWFAERVFVNLAHLNEVVDDLAQAGPGIAADKRASEVWDTRLTDEVISLLRPIHHSCLFYKLDHAAQLALALEDLYSRAGQGEIPAGVPLLNSTQTFTTRLGRAIQALQDGEIPELADIEAMLHEIEHTGVVRQGQEGAEISTDILRSLELPPEFNEVFTPDSLRETSQAVQDGADFYLVLADLNADETIGLAFYEWASSDRVRLITNTTVYQGDRSLFNFLLATTEPGAAVEAMLSAMDPEGRYLTFQKCSLPSSVQASEVIPEPASQDVFSSPAPVPETITADKLGRFIGTVGELVVAYATLHRVVDRLTAADIVDLVIQALDQTGGVENRVRQQLAAALKPWFDDIQTLTQADNEIGASLDQLHQAITDLQTSPAAELLKPLENWVPDVARRYGKMVRLELSGIEEMLDHKIFHLLANPLRQLIGLLIAKSIEAPARREMLQKPGHGQVSVTIKKQEDQVQVVIEDDGGGLDETGDFGLAALTAKLQTERVCLRFTNEPGRGVRFVLSIPLERVVIDGMVVRTGKVHYVVPVSEIRRIVKADMAEIVRTSANGQQSMLRLQDQLIPIYSLTDQPGTNRCADALMIVMEKDQEAIAMVIDELIGQQQVLMRPLQGYLADIPGVSGCALLGEGDVGLVLNLSQLKTYHQN